MVSFGGLSAFLVPVEFSDAHACRPLIRFFEALNFQVASTDSEGNSLAETIELLHLVATLSGQHPYLIQDLFTCDVSLDEHIMLLLCKGKMPSAIIRHVITRCVVRIFFHR